MFHIFETTGNARKSRVFVDQEFPTPQAAIVWLTANAGPMIDFEFEGDDFAVCAVGKAVNIYTVELAK